MHLRSNVLKNIALGVTILWLSGTASAWCLGPKGCATDNSVCDFGRDAAYFLSLKTFVQAGAKRSAEIYERLAGRQILENCNDGQQLVLNSPRGDAEDRRWIPELAKAFCRVSDISEQQVTSRSEISDEPRYGFTVKCPITKFQQGREVYLAKEGEVTTQALLDEANAPPPAPGGAFPDPLKPKPGCGKMTFGSLIGLGPCSGKQ